MSADEKKSETKLQFYGCDLCPFAQRSWIAILEKESNPETPTLFDYHHITLENKPKFLSAINPFATVPSAQYKGVNLWESLELNEWIDETFPSHPLTPDGASSDPAARAYGRFRVRLALSKLKQFSSAYYNLVKPGDAAAHEAATKNLLQQWQELNDYIVGPFILGSQFTLVDIALFPFAERQRVVCGHYRGFKIPEGDAKYAKALAWYAACAARPSVRITMADRTGDSLKYGCYEAVERNAYLVEAYEAYAWNGLDYLKKMQPAATAIDEKTGIPVGARKRVVPAGVLEARYNARQAGERAGLTGDALEAAVNAAGAGGAVASAAASTARATPAAGSS